MLFIKILRYLQGYAVLEAFGGFPERFINLCTRNGVPLWNIESSGGIITARTTADSLEEVRKTAEKSGMEIKVISVSSLKQTFQKHKSRKAFLITLFLCFLMTAFLSFFIWSVSVEGNESYTNEEILSVFENQGVKIGALKHGIDTRKVSENALSLLSDLSWAKVNIRGCFAVIEVRERIKKPPLLDESTPVNIVAKEDGQILKYEVSKGRELLKPGIAVTKGELLVSGVLTNADGSERLVHAKANVTAKVTHSVKGKSQKKLYRLSDEKIKKSIFFFGITLPSFKTDENCFEERSYLDNGKKILPAGIFRYRSAEYENEYEIGNTEESLLNALCFDRTVAKIYDNAQSVIKSKIKISNNVITGELICEEKIGVEKEILLG